MARIYLTIVGLLYAGLAAWCTFSPMATSAKVGFELPGDSGKSEFMTVYGGLEFGMALIFLMPLLRKDATAFSLIGCICIHASLVAWRSVSLMIYQEFGSMTTKLAIGEWVLLLSAIGIWFATRKS